MGKPCIYLAGLISTEHPESLKWREQVAPVLSARATVLSPMRGKENLAKTSKDGGITDPALTSRDIIQRDYADVSAADVILVHLERFGSERPLTGTIMELAWAWEKHTPVVAVASSDNLLMRNHPFVKECVSHYCETTEDALAILWRHYLYPLGN